jgi:sulfite reductase alpha subunit-like flavoprotein
MVLFYGCRHKDQDFLFQKELNSFVQTGKAVASLRECIRPHRTQSLGSRSVNGGAYTGVLNEVVSAFSHDQEERVFVQDRIREKRELVASYVQHKDAIYYYCGCAPPQFTLALAQRERVCSGSLWG